MKKTGKLLSIFCLISVITLLASCDTNDKDSATPLTKTEQMTTLQKAGEEFLNEMSVSQFVGTKNEVIEFARVFSLAGSSAIRDSLINSATITSDGVMTYDLYNFKGHFTADTLNHEWIYSKADDLKFIFNDKGGKNYVATVSVSKEATKTILIHQEEISAKLLTRVVYRKTYVKVPKQINISLTQGSSTVMSFTLNPDLSKMAGDFFNPLADIYTGSGSLTFGAVTIDVNNFAFSANKSASVDANIHKGDKNIMSLSMSTEGPNIIGVADSTVRYKGLKNLSMNVDVVGKVQFKGTCSNVPGFMDCIQQAMKNSTDESAFNTSLASANNLMDLGIYFGNNLKQASLYLDPSKTESGAWRVNPIIKMTDSSESVSIEDYFGSLIDSFSAWAKDMQQFLPCS